MTQLGGWLNAVGHHRVPQLESSLASELRDARRRLLAVPRRERRGELDHDGEGEDIGLASITHPLQLSSRLVEAARMTVGEEQVVVRVRDSVLERVEDRRSAMFHHLREQLLGSSHVALNGARVHQRAPHGGARRHATSNVLQDEIGGRLDLAGLAEDLADGRERDARHRDAHRLHLAQGRHRTLDVHRLDP